MKRYRIQRVYEVPGNTHWEYGTRVEDIESFDDSREMWAYIETREKEDDAHFLITEFEPEYGGGYWQSTS